ncbi:hypothetical protein B5F07_12280 [Lachnoclostridium sp. An169]|uniref:helix-turn-helix transcriptional regulator n=1 Tax=Lachnoclostridium sp. An169 TaxID=1965569 RepID=UPI000B386728|nr:helix-turn-helix domain-containing protein [Lachnoclostridium sp. An169]OUP82941.1 hypothetical protein B5F07_12280 [Lachnoclostridium sp. An169]
MFSDKDGKYYHEIVSPEKNVPVRIFFSNDRRPSYVPPHFHEDIEMIYLLSGSLTVSSGYKRRTFFPGDLLLFNSNEIHSTLSEVSDTTAYVLQIPHGLFQPYYPSGETSVFEVPAVSSGTLSCDASAQISHLKELILTCYELQSRRPEFYQILIMNNIYRILYILFHSFSVFQPASRRQNMKHYERLSFLTTYINEHYSESLSLEKLADMVSVAPSYLSKFFRQETGTTLTSYISSVRLEHAYTDLLTTDYSINYVAEKNGFASYAMFVQKFKEKYLCTPNQVRRRKS